MGVSDVYFVDATKRIPRSMLPDPLVVIAAAHTISGTAIFCSRAPKACHTFSLWAMKPFRES